MAPQRLEKIESAPGNGMGSKPRTYKMWYTVARLAIRDSASVASNRDWSHKRVGQLGSLASP